MAPWRRNARNVVSQSGSGVRRTVPKKKFEGSRNRLATIKKASTAIDHQAIAYIRPDWRSQEKELSRRFKKLPKNRLLSVNEITSPNVSVQSKDSTFNIFSDFIHEDITHDTIVLDDTLYDSDADADITVVDEVNVNNKAELERSSDTIVAATSGDNVKDTEQISASKSCESGTECSAANTEPRASIDDSSSGSQASIITLSDSESECSFEAEVSATVPEVEVQEIKVADGGQGRTAALSSQPIDCDLTLIDEANCTLGTSAPKQSVSILGAPTVGPYSRFSQQGCSSPFCLPRERNKLFEKNYQSKLESCQYCPTNLIQFVSSVQTTLLSAQACRAIESPMTFVDLLTEGTAFLCKRILRCWDVAQTVFIMGAPIRICSYNVLCQDTISKTQYLYKHLACAERAYQLQWPYRSNLLAKEFSMISADILCLQEVQEEHFYNFYVPVLAKAGYKGQFKKRTRDMVDGCAIFYKPPMTLVSYQPIEYFVGEDTVLNRDNIGQLARFKEMFTGRELCIANTHLLFNKKRGDVKLAQLALLLAHLDKECGPNSARPCPYVLCGDFNMEPRCPIYEFLMNGRLSFENLRSGHLSGSGENGGRLLRTNLMPPQTMIGTNCRFGFRKNGVVSSYSKANEWTHSLQFASAYTHTSVDYWPEVSAFSSDGAFNPDFLFYSISSRNPLPPGDANGAVNLVEGPLRLIRRLALPSELMLRTTLGPWPNQVTPSDHIPLIADFILQ